MNPRGQLPVLKDGIAIVNESLAALQYLDQAYPEPCLVPKDSAPQVSQSPQVQAKAFEPLLFFMLLQSSLLLCSWPVRTASRAILTAKGSFSLITGYMFGQKGVAQA